MRKALLLGVIAALSIAGAAYGASSVTNIYTVHTKLRPKRSGTKANPMPIRGHFEFEVATNPPGQRPNIVKTLTLRIQGARENTGQFPACGTARLMSPSEGPSTCPRKSLFATGYLIAQISNQGDQSPSGTVLTCRVELSIYNGGNHTVTYYVYTNSSAPPSQGECPSPPAKPEAFVAALTLTSKGLVLTATLPQDLRHPSVTGSTGTTTFDAALIKGVANVFTVTRIVRRGPAGHKRNVTIGLFTSTFCPANRQRQIAYTFTQEDGGSRTATQLVRCHY